MTTLLKLSFFIMLSLISISAFIICVFISLESNFIKNDQFPSAIFEKDGSLYCQCKATGGFDYQIIDDKTTYKIVKITPNKIIFTGNITTYVGYESDVGQPYNIEATIELINNNWIVTQNIEK